MTQLTQRLLIWLSGIGAGFAIGLALGYTNPGAAWEPLAFWGAIALAWVGIIAQVLRVWGVSRS